MESVEPDQLFDAVKENVTALVPKHIIPDDIVSSISYILGLPFGIGTTDGKDALAVGLQLFAVDGKAVVFQHIAEIHAPREEGDVH